MRSYNNVIVLIIQIVYFVVWIKGDSFNYLVGEPKSLDVGDNVVSKVVLFLRHWLAQERNAVFGPDNVLINDGSIALYCKFYQLFCWEWWLVVINENVVVVEGINLFFRIG